MIQQHCGKHSLCHTVPTSLNRLRSVYSLTIFTTISVHQYASHSGVKLILQLALITVLLHAKASSLYCTLSCYFCQLGSQLVAICSCNNSGHSSISWSYHSENCSAQFRQISLQFDIRCYGPISLVLMLILNLLHVTFLCNIAKDALCIHSAWNEWDDLLTSIRPPHRYMLRPTIVYCSAFTSTLSLCKSYFAILSPPKFVTSTSTQLIIAIFVHVRHIFTK